MLGLLQLFHGSPDKNRVKEGAKHSSEEGDPVEMQKFGLDDGKGPVHTMQKVTILPFGTVNVHASTSVKGGSCAHVTDTRSPVASHSGTPVKRMENCICGPQGY